MKRAIKENAIENPTAAPETGVKNPAPVSIDGAGDGAVLLSSSNAVAAAVQKMTATKTSVKALELLTWAMPRVPRKVLQNRLKPLNYDVSC